MPATKTSGSSQQKLSVILVILIICILMPDADARRPLFEEDTPLVVIDPGHGGNDEGARGPSQTREKTITLNLAHMLTEQLKDRYRVLLTRNDDYSLDPAARTAVANHNKAEIFISLHTGSSFVHNINGSAVYFYQPFQESALTTEIQPPRSLQDTHPEAAWSAIQIKYRITSEKLANQIRSRLALLWQPQVTEVQGAPLRVLEGADMPAVAIEIGNLANSNAEKTLGDPEFLSRIAKAIRSGIDDFFAEKPK
jgi:N-acetylmuramoyl-L-alanine amidase